MVFNAISGDLMGIDYEVCLKCPVKEKLGRSIILSLLKGRNQARAVIRVAREQGDDEPVAEMMFGRVVSISWHCAVRCAPG
jgi:hypothetical protein